MKTLKLKIIAMAFMVTALPLGAQTAVTGRVFEDSNKNRSEDPGEKPISGVWVTDGFSIACTDWKGNFTLETHPECVHIYLRVPDKYRSSGNFYLAYMPEKTVGYDFGLVPTPDVPPRFVQMADNEESIYREWIDDMKQWLRNEPVGFVIVTGDICYTNGLYMHAREFNSRTMDTPVFYTLGNHDLVHYKQHGDDLYRELFGPVWYSFDLGGVHFIVLPMMAGDVKPSYTAAQAFGWVSKDLATLRPGQKVVFFSHDLMLSEENEHSVFSYKSDTLDISKYDVEAYIYGHRHTQITQEFPDNIIAYGTGCAHKGAIDHTPSLYRVFTILPEGTLNTYDHFTTVNRQLQANVFIKDGVSHIHVNTWHSSASVTQVTVENGKGELTSLNRTSSWGWDGTAEDPRTVRAYCTDGSLFVQHLVDGLQHVVGRQSAPDLSWALPLGGFCAPGPPVTDEENIYIATYDNRMGPDNRITAVNPSDGRIVWRFQTENAVKGHMDLSGGLLVAADVTGTVYCLDTKTGTLRWKHDLFPERFSTAYQMGVVAENERVYLSNGANGCALDLKTGEIIWNNNFKLTGITNITQLTVTDSLLITGSQWSGRVALRKENGQKVWGPVGLNDLSYNDSAPVFFDGKLYFCSHTHLSVLNPATGELLESQPASPALAGSASRPYVSDSLIIVGTYDRGVMAWNRLTLKQKWSFRTRPTLLYTGAYSKDSQETVEASPLIKDGVVYFGAGDGLFYALEEKTGTFLWSINLGAPVLSKALLLSVSGQEYLYVTDFSGTLYKIRPLIPEAN